MASQEGEDAAAIGIDLGTTYSCVAVWRRGHVEVIPNEHGSRTTPSCVAFTDKGRLFGDAALNQAAHNPTNTVFGVKRLIGRRFSDAIVQHDKKFWPFKVVGDANDNPKIEVKYKDEVKQFEPVEISAMVVAKIKEIAKDYLGTTVNDAVITVPAYFSDSQRRATRDAGLIAGLNVLRVINEPMAAAVAYGLNQEAIEKGKKNVLVFDLGGGTLDVCIITLDKEAFNVRSVAGNNHLGGEDFDDNMVTGFIRYIKKKYQKDISSNPRAIRRLRNECEKAKRFLSAGMTTTIEIDSLVDGLDFQCTISRSEFEKFNKSLFHECLESVKKCLIHAKMDRRNIDEVVLVGGSTRIPCVQKMLEDFFDKKKLCKTINPDEAVAYGAAIYAAMLSNNNSQKVKIPVKLSEVTPLSLGIGVHGNLMEVLIPRNTTIPAMVEKPFTTIRNWDREVTIFVLEGEGFRAEDNDLLGKFVLSGIPLAPRGVPQIIVTFEIDVNGILNVTAREIRAGVANNITITKDRMKLSADKVESIVQQAEKFRRDDDEQNSQMIAENTLDELIYSLGTIIEEDRKLSTEEKKMIEEAIERATVWRNSPYQARASDIKMKVQELQNLKQQIISSTAAVYESGSTSEIIIQQDEIFEVDEDEYRRLIIAKNDLDKLIMNLESIIKNEDISTEEEKMVEGAIKRIIEWKKSSVQIKVHEYNNHKEELERLRKQILGRPGTVAAHGSASRNFTENPE